MKKPQLFSKKDLKSSVIAIQYTGSNGTELLGNLFFNCIWGQDKDIVINPAARPAGKNRVSPGQWVLLLDNIPAHEIDILDDEDFRKLYEPLDTVNPSAYLDPDVLTFAARLQTLWDQTKAKGEINEDTEGEQLFTLLADTLTSFGEGTEDYMTIALCTFLLDKKMDFTPGQLLMADMRDEAFGPKVEQ